VFNNQELKLIDAQCRLWEAYMKIIADNLNFYIKHGMGICCWFIMKSHMRLIFRDKDKHPDKILSQFKPYTSNVLQR